MNIKEAEIATINAAIADKTDIYSVSTADVADRFKEIVALLGAVLVNVDLTYNIGFIVYTASPFAVYVCKVDGATGDIGPTGSDGATGASGATGATGEAGDDGFTLDGTTAIIIGGLVTASISNATIDGGDF